MGELCKDTNVKESSITSKKELPKLFPKEALARG